MPPTLRSMGARAAPLALAGGFAYAVYTLNYKPVRNDEARPKVVVPRTLTAKSVFGTPPPFAAVAWGANDYLTLSPDNAAKQIRRPTAMTHLGSTPLRDMAIQEKYGAAVDARGDLWMWGVGYDPSGAVGRSLRGKKLCTIAAAPGKLFALSKKGRLFVVSADKSFQDFDKAPRGYWKKLTTRDPLVDFVELTPKLQWGEKWADVAVGRDHLLAVTNQGRTFSLPLTPSANTHRQLGTKQVFPTPDNAVEALATGPVLPPESDPRFATQMTEIPALSGIQIHQVAASDRSSFVRTHDGRVLGFGANDNGQIGLGSSATVATVPTPVEIVLSKAYPPGTDVKCTSVDAGSATTFFTVEHQRGDAPSLIDLLSCGNGQSGALGTGMWSSASFVPAKIKSLSSLTEFSETTQKATALAIHHISVSTSPNTHVFAVLDTVAQADAKGLKEGLFGKDAMVWGGNGDYQLGNGKRSSVATPQHLPSLIPHAIDTIVDKSQEVADSPIPVTRLQLHSAKADAFDLQGKLIVRGVKVEEVLVAGYNCSVLYNKIVDA